jgi:hypothetical protein
MPRVATVNVKMSPDESEDIFFEYGCSVNADGMYVVHYVKLKIPLFGTPNDLKTDLEEAIAEDLGVFPGHVVIECEIQKVSKYYKEIAA